jgi:transposase
MVASTLERIFAKDSRDQWAQVKDLLPIQPGPRSRRRDRPFVNAVMWRLKTGAPWRDIPEQYGLWKTSSQSALTANETHPVLATMVIHAKRRRNFVGGPR